MWIPPNQVESRLTTSIVGLLSLIAYNFVFNDDLPKLSYLTSLDRYILLSYLFCAIPTFLTIYFSRLTKKDYNNLPDEIKKHEPAIALTDFDEGLIFYKKIHKHLPYFLKKNGILLIEIGLTHTKKTIDSIFRNSAYRLLWHKDLNGDYRVLEVKKIV